MSSNHPITTSSNPLVCAPLYRPISTSFPLGLFCNASWSLTPHRSLTETPFVPLPLDRKLLDMPTIDPENDELNDALILDDKTA
jgi:hypothetical protein